MGTDQKASILLVDDRAENLLALEAVLGVLGEHLVSARSGEEALRCLLKQDFAVILLDVQLLGMDGFETARAIRSRERSRNTPIIFLTAVGKNEESVFRGYSLGAVDYLLKPLVPEVLRAKVVVFVELFKKSELIKQQAALLAAANQELEGEIRERRLTEEALRKAKEELDVRVEERTAELRDANQRLQLELTERQRAEQALQDSEHRYRLLFQGNPHPMWVYDVETLAFLAVNDAAVRHYGYSREEFLAMTPKDLRAPEDGADPLNPLALQGEGSTIAREEKHRKKDGSATEVEVARHRLTFAGRPAVLALANDIADRKSLEEQLRQSQKMEAIGQLAGGVAHDFNNLLTVITGHVQLLLRRLGPDGAVRERLEEIKNAGDRAASLIRQLLAFSRRQVLRPHVLDLNGVVENMDKMLRRLIGEDIDLVARLEPKLGRVKVDPGQVEQVIMNLAVNARDAMPHGGKLTIETANVDLDESYARGHVDVTPASYVMLAVSDTGCGMTPETQARIFEPFFTTKEQGKGTGLGLATVYGIVKQSRGNIWVYSEPGRGTSFKVYLPRVEGAVKPIQAHTVQPEALHGSETVLLVEDEETVRSLVRGILKSQGYEVLEASRGKEAMTICQAHKGPIHLLVTDVVMPQVSGRELANQLTSLRPDLKVLYMSGYSDGAILQHGVLDSEAAFLQKPFTPDAMARKVREVLDA